MDSNLVVGGVVLAVILSGIAVFNGGQRGQDGKDGRDGITVGATPSLNSPMDIQTGGTIFGGGELVSQGQRTLCDLETGPATSTGSFFISLQNKETYAVDVRAGYGSTVGATTTYLGTVNTVAAGSGLNITASTTGVFFPPNSHLVLNINATTSAVDSNFNPVGGCTFLGSSY